MTVRDTKKPLPAFARRLVITVGIHADDGAKPHAANDDDERRELTVADVATFNEFGVSAFSYQRFFPDGSAAVYEHPGIPARPFIRGWFDEDQEFIRKTLDTQMHRVAAGRATEQLAAEQIALLFEGRVKLRIARGVPPPNAPSTIARKGSSKPLIDKGQLRASIRGRAVIEQAEQELPGEAAAE